jgi:hypothetical protein
LADIRDQLGELMPKIWKLINDLALDYGAWVVSAPDTSPIRLECLDQELPLQLERMNFEIRSLGTSERLVPIVETIPDGCGRTITRQHVAQGTVLVFEICLETGYEPRATSTVPSS